MTTAVKDTVVGNRLKVSLYVVVLCFLVASICVFAASTQALYANEPGGAQIQEQQGEAQSGEAGEAATDAEGSVGYQAFDTQDIINAQTSNSGSTIPDVQVPLASGVHSSQSTSADSVLGSVFNTVLVVLCALSMLAMLVALTVRKTRNYRVIAVRTIAVTFGLVTITTWSLLDRLQMPETLFNDSTAIISSFFLIYLVLAVYSYLYEARLNKAETPQEAKL